MKRLREGLAILCVTTQKYLYTQVSTNGLKKNNTYLCVKLSKMSKIYELHTYSKSILLSNGKGVGVHTTLFINYVQLYFYKDSFIKSLPILVWLFNYYYDWISWKLKIKWQSLISSRFLTLTLSTKCVIVLFLVSAVVFLQIGLFNVLQNI